jgi:PAS domain S-box-containing protein
MKDVDSGGPQFHPNAPKAGASGTPFHPNAPKAGASGTPLFETFLKSAQYLFRLQTQQDIWDHLGQFVLSHFPATWLAVVEREAGGRFALHYAAPASGAATDLLTSEVQSTVADVLESGFLAARVLPPQHAQSRVPGTPFAIPAPSMTVFLPVVETGQAKRVMLIGHADAQPLAREVLDVYLALAGLAGAAAERKRAEQEVRELNAELEGRVSERTAQLQTANAELLKEVAERRRAEEALRQNREWLRVTLTSIGDAVIAADTHGRITFLNPVAAALTGWQAGEAQGQPLPSVFRILNEQTGVPAEDIVARVLREGHAVGLANHTALLARSGEVVPIEDSAAPIRDDAGNIMGVVLVFHDVTEKRETELKIQQQTQVLETFVEHAPASLAMFDRRMRYVLASKRWLKDCGIEDKAVLLGKSHYEVFPELPHHWREAHVRGLAGEVLKGESEEWVALDGKRHTIHWEIYPWGNSGAETGGIIILMEDITERRRAEQTLLQSEKLASVGRMAASIAHEINNPLEAVVNALYLARTSADVRPPLRQYLDIADDELKRVSHITRQTLGFYRESSTPTAVCAGLVLDSTLDLLRGKINLKRAVIHQQYGRDLFVTAVAGELRQVLSNLLANSLDAIDEEGAITLRVSRFSHVRSGRPGVRITVADNGKGIDAVTLPRIFEPLFTTKEATGSGLGLWVSKQLVEKHHGSIRVRSSSEGKNRGTVVSLVLPAVVVRSQAAGA